MSTIHLHADAFGLIRRNSAQEATSYHLLTTSSDMPQRWSSPLRADGKSPQSLFREMINQYSISRVSPIAIELQICDPTMKFGALYKDLLD
jgi:hypothetical protein